MDLLTLLNNSELKIITTKYIETKEEKRQLAYNLFTVSSYNAYLENFHSDILASLLNPIGLHKEGNAFLHLFIDYLNAQYNVNIEVKDFERTIVTREKGRLDIWIRDERSKQCIIIENKINNADDMDEQLDRYFTYSEQKHGFEVKAIIYLSLDGTKQAPPTIEKLEHLVKNIGAFTNEKNDLTIGWLQTCFQSATNVDSSSLIWQYIKLLKHLANKNMDTNTMDQLYDFLSKNNGLQTVATLLEMNNRMSAFRADKFAKVTQDYTPFRKQYRYRDNYWLYEKYEFEGSMLKLDVWFENDGSANLVFWNTSLGGELGRNLLTKKLEKIGLLEEFETNITHNDNGYPKYFRIDDKYQNVAQVDAAIEKFVKKFFEKLITS